MHALFYLFQAGIGSQLFCVLLRNSQQPGQGLPTGQAGAYSIFFYDWSKRSYKELMKMYYVGAKDFQDCECNQP